MVKLDTEFILDFYLKEIRPLAEQGVAIWNSGLTKNQSNELEKIQKIAFKIILDDNYTSYDVACTLLNISPLVFRRSDLCTNLAIKLYKSPRSADFFTPTKKGRRVSISKTFIPFIKKSLVFKISHNIHSVNDATYLFKEWVPFNFTFLLVAVIISP